MNREWKEFKREIDSQYHEDHMANKGEYTFQPVKAVTSIVTRYCSFPECSCEGEDGSILVYCDLPDKPRFRIHFRELDPDVIRLIPRWNGFTHHVQVWNLDDEGGIDQCIGHSHMTLERG